MADDRLDAATFHRNHGPLHQVMLRHLPPDATGEALEIASGSGQHAVAFAQRWGQLRWTPSDIGAPQLTSIAAWRKDAIADGVTNLAPPLMLDVTKPTALAAVSSDLRAIVAINLLHIAPWAVTEALVAGAGSQLGEGGQLFVYGPFHRHGRVSAPSNAAFDASLRARDAAWGVRHMEEVADCAAGRGLDLTEVADVPADNFVLVFTRRARADALR
ncbi:MAG: DUF938 domain-containing protein [Pseudomonadota bacterium]